MEKADKQRIILAIVVAVLSVVFVAGVTVGVLATRRASRLVSENGEKTDSAEEERAGTGAESDPPGSASSAEEPEDHTALSDNGSSTFLAESDSGSVSSPVSDTVSESSPVAAENAGVSADSQNEYEEGILSVFRDRLTAKKQRIRYYKEAPNVPCMGIGAFYAMLTGSNPEITNDGNGRYTLKGSGGAAAILDVNTGELYSEDYLGFSNLMWMLSSGAGPVYYGGSRFIKPAETDMRRRPDPVRLSFSKYGISVYGDGQDVYLPIMTLSDLFADTGGNCVTLSGRRLYIDKGIRRERADQRDSGYYKGIFDKDTLSADAAAYAYHELCFTLDNFYGLPDKAKPGRLLSERGFDGALKEYSSSSQYTAQLLCSGKKTDMVYGMNNADVYLSDGLSTLWQDPNRIFGKLSGGRADAFQSAYRELDRQHPMEETYEERYADPCSAIRALRKRSTDSSSDYREEGDTAMLSLDELSVDYKGWDSYYDRGEEMPREKDAVGMTVNALNRAKKNKEIRNFVIDLTGCSSGEPDAVIALMSLLSGRNYLYVQSTLTGQEMVAGYAVDRNFDGEFNDQDREVEYPFRFSVLLSGQSRYCANMLAGLLKDEGVLILGEKSRGGACIPERRYTALGLPYILAGNRIRLLNKDRESMEDGIPVNVELLNRTGDGTPETVYVDIREEDENNNTFTKTVEIPDYSGFYDLKKLSEILEDW